MHFFLATRLFYLLQSTDHQTLPPCFIQQFSEFWSTINFKYNRILITGDFNLHMDMTNDPYASEFSNLLNSMNFNVTQPTHNRGHPLDLVITYTQKNI